MAIIHSKIKYKPKPKAHISQTLPDRIEQVMGGLSTV